LISLFEKQYIAVLLIIGISLTVFYPTLNSNVIDLDDTTMILNLNNPDNHYPVKDLFRPHGLGIYYRPLLMLSFIVDSKIWMYEFSGYHLTNIIFHLLNALVFYFIALAFFKGKPRFRMVSFFLAIGFVLNPLTIESVAWISGRTDILSAFFSLIAFFFYLSGLKFKSVFVSIFFLSGLLAKENAICLFLIIILCEFAFNYPGKGVKYSAVRSLSWAGILAVPLFAYLYLRFAGFGLVQFQEQINPVPVQGLHLKEGVSLSSQMISGFFTLPAAIAFYLKKLIYPFPLNFAISQINLPLYSVVFVFIVLVCTVLVIKKKFYYPFWILLMCISFLPALPVALADVAWTRFAERYLYLSVPLICLFSGDLFYKNCLRFPEKVRVIKTIAFLILIFFCFASIQRVNIWRDRKSLWADTLKKNPTNGKVLYKYGSVLGGKKGLPYFKRAVEHSKDSEWRDFSLLILAREETNNFNYNKAYDLIREAIEINPERQNCYKAAGILRRIIKVKHLAESKYTSLEIKCYNLAYEKSPNPEDLLKLIQIFDSLNDEDNIKKYTMLLKKKFPTSKPAKYVSTKYSKY